jgi:Mrp family chromosome partitioning ATPase
MASGMPAIELALGDYVRELRRGWKVVAGATAVLTVLILALSLSQTKVYEASLDILIQRGPGRPGLMTERPDMGTELLIARSSAVKDLAEERVGFPFNVNLYRVGDSIVIHLVVEASSLTRARDAAGAYAKALVEVRERQLIGPLEETRRELQTQLDGLNGNPAGTALDPAQTEQVAAAVESIRKAVQVRDAAALRTAIAGLEGTAGVKATQGSGQLIRGAALQLLVDEIDAIERLARNGGPEVVAPAAGSASPVRPAPLRNAVVAAALGLLIGIGVVLVRAYLDRRVYDADTLRAVTGLPVLGTVGVSERRSRFHREAESTDRADLQELRAALQLADVGESVRVVQLTASRSGPALHRLAAQLGAAFERASRSAIVVVADVRSQRVSAGRTGDLNSINAAGVDALLAAAPTMDGVRIIQTEEASEDPAAFLGSSDFSEFINALRARADLIIVVSPPVLHFRDALLVGRSVDATVLVAPVGISRATDLVAAIERLDRNGQPTLGTILTGAGQPPAGEDAAWPTNLSDSRAARSNGAPRGVGSSEVEEQAYRS